MSMVKTHRMTRRIKGMVEIRIVRNGHEIFRFKRKRDLFVWRGQMVFVYLLSQGNIGTETSAWYVLASENSTAPNMGDDSQTPDATEFDPLIGSPVSVTYDFDPSVKPSGGYQTYADLIIDGTVISNGSKTLRKVGLIDKIGGVYTNIIFEDAVVDKSVILNDEIYIRYTIQLG